MNLDKLAELLEEAFSYAKTEEREHMTTRVSLYGDDDDDLLGAFVTGTDDACLIAHAPTLAQRVLAVAELHQRAADFCDHCSYGDHLVWWPCPTMKALEGTDDG